MGQYEKSQKCWVRKLNRKTLFLIEIIYAKFLSKDILHTNLILKLLDFLCPNDYDSRNFKHIIKNPTFFPVPIAISKFFESAQRGEKNKSKWFHHLKIHIGALWYFQSCLNKQRDTTLTFGEIMGPMIKLHWKQCGLSVPKNWFKCT